MHICIFEDQEYRKLLPLVYLRPVYDLRCGITTIREKIIRSFSDTTVTLHAREYLAEILGRDHPDCHINEIPSGVEEALFINGRVLADGDLADQLAYAGRDYVLMKGDVVVAAWVSGKNFEKLSRIVKTRIFYRADFSHLDRRQTEAGVIAYPWELVSSNGEQIAADFGYLTDGSPQILGELHDGIHLLNESQIHVSTGAEVKPGAVLDAEGGPIYVGKKATILPNAVIEGPAYVGDNSLIKVGAKIYENTSIGEVCKVGGEVEESIIHAYSNKQHEGFIGHAYLGTWVNIGADTNNSDLKNDYGTVKVFVDGELIDSGSMFVGLIMGDHSKTGINLMFNTGTVIGVNCNVYGSGQPPKFVPSFSWGSAEGGFVTYRIEKAYQVAERVVGRRNIQFTDLDRRLFQTVFDLSGEERQRAGVN